MDLREILALYDREQRIEIEYPKARKETTPQVIRFVSLDDEWGFIQYSQLDETNANAEIREQIDYFKHIQHHFEWKVYGHDQPADLKERLIKHGFRPEEDEAVMVLDLKEASEELLSPAKAEIHQIREREGLGEVRRVLEQVWGREFDWLIPRLGDNLEIPGYLSVYVAYSAGVPASCAWAYFHPGSQFASLWGGSTVEGYRRSGLYTSLLAARAQEAIRRGYRFLTLDASPMSRPITAKHGFRLLTTAVDCEWKVSSG